ncbi:MAG: TonB-dependent receptor [Novosphingobium sp.]|nr:TonB-dependent receptor [Novosphingobium sp.]
MLKAALLISSILCGSVPVMAQSVSADPAQNAAPSGAAGLEDIVVTAQRRSQNLQDVPVAVAAVTGTQLQSAGVRDIVDLKLAVPTLNLTNSNGYLTTSLRGIGSNGVGPGVENPIATYIDGVYYASPAASLLSLNNVAQVEVLKGPQGTLFGRNATGGLIQVTTKTPSSTTGGQFNIGYSNFDTITANGYVTGGISGILAADLVVQYTHQGTGWGQNIASGKDVYKIDHDVAVRSKWLLTPSDDTTITLIGDYADTHNSMNPFVVFPGTINGVVPARGAEPDRGYDSNSDYPNLVDSWSGGGSIKWEQKLDELSFISTTAYRKSRSDVNFDYDVTELPLRVIISRQHDKQFSQEFQLSSKSSGKFTWVLGAFYFNATSDFRPFDLILNDAGVKITVNAKQRTRSLAGYAQGTYEIFPDTNLTLGGRYTSDKRNTYDGTLDVFVIPLNLQQPTVVAPDREKSYSKFTFRASLDHRFSDAVMAYASFNRGFKGGGFTTAQPGTDPYRPESIDAIELGLKTDLLDRRLRINIAGFHYDYSDIQIQVLRGGSIGIINGPSAKIYGIDMDFQAIVTDSLRLSGGLGWTHSRFGRFVGCQVGTPIGGTPVNVAGDCSGNQLPLASDWLGNLNADYTVPLASGSLNLNGNIYYNNGFFPESDNIVKQKAYAQLGASIRWTSENERLTLSAFGKNLTNRRVINFESTTADGSHSGFFAAPRTYGISAGVKF